ncbi:polysaccharide biosynthesis tyrosine autokinase [Niabella terrae]
MNENLNDKPELQQLSLRDLFYKYIRFLPLYLLFIAMAITGAWLYLRYTQEEYSATGTMLIDTEGETSDKVEELMSGGLKDRNLQNEIEVLASKRLLTRVVDQLLLQFTYTAKGNVKDVNAYKLAPFTLQVHQLIDSTKIFSFNIEIESNQKFKVNGTSISFDQKFTLPDGVFELVRTSRAFPGSEYIISYKPVEIAAAEMTKRLSVQPKVSNTGILTIVYQSPNPYLSADVANSIMQQYNAMSVEQNTLSLKSKIDFADKRLNELQADIDSLKNRLVRYQKNNDLIDATSQIQQHLSVAGVQQELVQGREIALSSLSQIETYLQNKSNAFSSVIVPSSLGIEDLTLNSMIARYNEVQIQRRSLLEANVTEENPRIGTINQNLELLRKSILENIRILKANYQQLLAKASNQKSQNHAAASDLPEKAGEQKDLERQLASKQALFDILNENRELGALSVSGTLSGGSILENATPNLTPVKPSPGTVKLVALLLGLLLPTAFIFIKELLNDRINTRTDIQKVTEAPILGEIGHSAQGKTLVVNKTNRSLISEQFRIIRSNLQYIIGKKDKAVILVTSSFSGEGKSFISTNLGAVLALTDKKTVILEFDLRKPRILAGLGLNKNPGVSNYMVSNTELDELLLPVPGESNLYVLPCGPIPPNPSELLLSERITELFEKLKENFDYVVVDTAPVGMVSDALTLGKYADCTLYVTRQGRTFKKQIGLIDEMYRLKKLPHLSIILNDVKMPTGGGYYGNYGYGYYGSGEQSGYYDDEVHTKTLGQKLAAAFNPVNWFSSRK